MFHMNASKIISIVQSAKQVSPFQTEELGPVDPEFLLYLHSRFLVLTLHCPLSNKHSVRHGL